MCVCVSVDALGVDDSCLTSSAAPFKLNIPASKNRITGLVLVLVSAYGILSVESVCTQLFCTLSR